MHVRTSRSCSADDNPWPRHRTRCLHHYPSIVEAGKSGRRRRRGHGRVVGNVSSPRNSPRGEDEIGVRVLFTHLQPTVFDPPIHSTPHILLPGSDTSSLGKNRPYGWRIHSWKERWTTLQRENRCQKEEEDVKEVGGRERRSEGQMVDNLGARILGTEAGRTKHEMKTHLR